MSELKRILENMGATPSQLNSKILEMAEEAIAVNEGVLSSTAAGTVDRIDHEIDSLSRKLLEIKSNITALNSTAEDMRALVVEVKHEVIGFTDANSQSRIEDKRLKDALLVFSNMLSITKDVFGEENMTENVMIQAIESGSFGVWRSIMGKKFDDSESTYSPLFGKSATRRY